jgi:hypothetical protein
LKGNRSSLSLFFFLIHLIHDSCQYLGVFRAQCNLCLCDWLLLIVCLYSTLDFVACILQETQRWNFIAFILIFVRNNFEKSSKGRVSKIFNNINIGNNAWNRKFVGTYFSNRNTNKCREDSILINFVPWTTVNLNILLFYYSC